MSEEEAEPRNLSALLLLAIYCVPILFCWLLLRRGYRRSLRQAAFTYTAVNLALGIVWNISH